MVGKSKRTWLTVERFSVRRKRCSFQSEDLFFVLGQAQKLRSRYRITVRHDGIKSRVSIAGSGVWRTEPAFGSASLRHPVVFLYGIWFMISITGKISNLVLSVSAANVSTTLFIDSSY